MADCNNQCSDDSSDPKGDRHPHHPSELTAIASENSRKSPIYRVAITAFGAIAPKQYSGVSDPHFFVMPARILSEKFQLPDRDVPVDQNK